jgi:hypothetical protein
VHRIHTEPYLCVMMKLQSSCDTIVVRCGCSGSPNQNEKESWWPIPFAALSSCGLQNVLDGCRLYQHTMLLRQSIWVGFKICS